LILIFFFFEFRNVPVRLGLSPCHPGWVMVQYINT
jgi:hypothetical protein